MHQHLVAIDRSRRNVVLPVVWAVCMWITPLPSLANTLLLPDFIVWESKELESLNRLIHKNSLPLRLPKLEMISIFEKLLQKEA